MSTPCPGLFRHRQIAVRKVLHLKHLPPVNKCHTWRGQAYKDQGKTWNDNSFCVYKHSLQGASRRAGSRECARLSLGVVLEAGTPWAGWVHPQRLDVLTEPCPWVSSTFRDGDWDGTERCQRHGSIGNLCSSPSWTELASALSRRGVQHCRVGWSALPALAGSISLICQHRSWVSSHQFQQSPNTQPMTALCISSEKQKSFVIFHVFLTN